MNTRSCSHARRNSRGDSIQAGGRELAPESGAVAVATAFDTEILTLAAPAGGFMNTIRNGADADGSIANAFCGLNP
jgi:hypothetical protein